MNEGVSVGPAAAGADGDAAPDASGALVRIMREGGLRLHGGRV